MPKPNAKQQLAVIGRLLKEADEFVEFVGWAQARISRHLPFSAEIAARFCPPSRLSVVGRNKPLRERVWGFEKDVRGYFRQPVGYAVRTFYLSDVAFTPASIGTHSVPFTSCLRTPAFFRG